MQNFSQNFTEMCRFWRMLKNAILDAKIHENFAKIWRNFHKNLTKFSLRKLKFLNDKEVVCLVRTSWAPRRCSCCSSGRPSFSLHCQNFSLCQKFVKISPNFSQILAKFLQKFASNIAFFSIFQNLQDFTKFCKKFCKSFGKILQNFANFLKFSKIFSKFCKILWNFGNFCKFACEKMIFL